MKKTLVIFSLLLLSITVTAQKPKPQPLTQEEFEALCPTRSEERRVGKEC